jgi:hypothetical protein
MRSGLMRMSEADPAAVKQYLLGRQMKPEIIDWKYFDAHFNRDRERGVVWVRDNQVAGFLGLIPFRIETDEVRADCAWSCDWSVDPLQGGGAGLLLLKGAGELYDGIFNLGGSEKTRQIFPRLADRTVPNAGISLVLPLRLGSVFARLPQGMVRRLLTRQESARQIPLRWVGSRKRIGFTIDPGLSALVLSLINDPPRGSWRPLYDCDFFDWQFRRCPAIAPWCCWVSSESPLRTAALVWRSTSSKAFWRLAFCGETNDAQKMEALIAAVISFVHGQGCMALFATASHLERDLIKSLGQRGFLRRGKLPLYAMRGRRAGLPIDEFCALSFLDADLAYRFELNGASPER